MNELRSSIYSHEFLRTFTQSGKSCYIGFNGAKKDKLLFFL